MELRSHTNEGIFFRILFPAIICAGYIGFLPLIFVQTSATACLGFLGVIQLTPFMVTSRKARSDTMGVVMLAQLAFYTIPKLIYCHFLSTEVEVADTVINEIIQMVVCTLISLFGYYTVKIIFGLKSFQVNEFVHPRLNNNSLIVLLALVGLPIALSDWIPPAIASATYALFFVGAVIITSSKFYDVGAKSLGIAVLLGYGLLLFLKSAMLGAFIGIFQIVFAYVLFKRRWHILFGSVLLIVPVIILHSVKAQFRSIVWHGDRDLSISERLDLVADFLSNSSDLGARLSENDSLDEDENKPDLLNKTVSRVNDNSLEIVLDKTPKQVPFWNGESYSYLLVAFIPRFLWPDKPVRDIWHRFGKAYDILDESDESTSISCSYLAEAYMNFGFVGLYFVAFLWGILVLLSEVSVKSLFRSPYLSAHILMCTSLMVYTVDLTSMVLNLILSILIWWALKSFFLEESAVAVTDKEAALRVVQPT